MGPPPLRWWELVDEEVLVDDDWVEADMGMRMREVRFLKGLAEAEGPWYWDEVLEKGKRSGFLAARLARGTWKGVLKDEYGPRVEKWLQECVEGSDGC